ncbi:quinone-dependent dihydroorotate dehydrogenase [Flavihumibacter petaseus]|uniref:Dihydroorotate dehydrogenase (quinone) n=1 Tax=Flavihumibacter petaseus NBRC 106054 TaxID=1220578 RepID=A0A0E9N5P0_9BACT|nr:quinone-dependent dihydroorotate dehydrogenase [Flavihumibacter petaseus]GAO45001.1 dihydroorotate dehydrogenase [Flavihumibacter petaseus NBRC 106054]
MYRLIRNLLFRFPTEPVHYFSMNSLQAACRVPGIRKQIARQFQPKGNLAREVFGLTFSNPVGLGAGFDKNARWLTELEALGFGSIEIGTVTPRPQSGNDKPRLFRLPKDQALINRMGFNNEGVKVIAERLRRWNVTRPDPMPGREKLIVGGNIGKNKVTPNEDAWKDYETCFRELFEVVDYFVVNVSSPNTPGLRELQEKDALHKILSHLQTINHQQPKAKPLLLKIAPDLTSQQVDDVIALAFDCALDGLVAANTTIDRSGLRTPSATIENIGAGGLSGAPLRSRSTDLVRYITEKSGGRIPIIASGGIFTADDAREKLAAGASLVQVWTGFIYEGPAVVKNICDGMQPGGGHSLSN